MFRKEHDIFCSIHYSNLHLDTEKSITYIQGVCVSSRRLLHRMYEAVQGLSSDMAGFALF